MKVFLFTFPLLNDEFTANWRHSSFLHVSQESVQCSVWVSDLLKLLYLLQQSSAVLQCLSLLSPELDCNLQDWDCKVIRTTGTRSTEPSEEWWLVVVQRPPRKMNIQDCEEYSPSIKAFESNLINLQTRRVFPFEKIEKLVPEKKKKRYFIWLRYGVTLPADWGWGSQCSHSYWDNISRELVKRTERGGGKSCNAYNHIRLSGVS